MLGEETPYLHDHRLHGEVARRLEGSRPGGQPVGGEGGDGAHAQKRVSVESANVLAQVVQLWKPQLSQDFLGLHACCATAVSRQERRKFGIVTKFEYRSERKCGYFSPNQTVTPKQMYLGGITSLME